MAPTDQRGFTLLEVAVTAGILAFITTLLLAGYRPVRDQQALLRTERTLQSLLRSTEQAALNEVRPEACLEAVGAAAEAQRRCSDRGIALQNQTAILFADTTDDNQFTAGSDIRLDEVVLESNVMGSSTWRSYVFEGTPPTIELYADGAVVGPGQSSSLSLQSGASAATLLISSYGHVTRQE